MMSITRAVASLLAAALVMVVLVAREARAINMDATFDLGALPSDFGFAGAGAVDPTTNVAGGVWTNNLPAATASVWNGGAAATGTVIGPVFHGYADITVTTFASANDDATILGFARDFNDTAQNLATLMYFLDGNIRFYTGSAALIDVPVANQDGLAHRYGWQIDVPSRILHLYFDDLPVGDPMGYSLAGDVFVGAPNAADDGFFYFGDGSGGTEHNEAWDRVVIAEGPYVVPEPSGLMLLGLGAFALTGLVWKRSR